MIYSDTSYYFLTFNQDEGKRVLSRNSIDNFSYSIDYLVSYKTFRIDDIDEKKDWYANHWHIDRPYAPYRCF